MGHTVERHARIYDDDTGEHIAVRPDADSLGLIDVVYVRADGEEPSRITMPFAQARLVAQEILRLADELEPTR